MEEGFEMLDVSSDEENTIDKMEQVISHLVGVIQSYGKKLKIAELRIEDLTNMSMVGNENTVISEILKFV